MLPAHVNVKKGNEGNDTYPVRMILVVPCDGAAADVAAMLNLLLS